MAAAPEVEPDQDQVKAEPEPDADADAVVDRSVKMEVDAVAEPATDVQGKAEDGKESRAEEDINRMETQTDVLKEDAELIGVHQHDGIKYIHSWHFDEVIFTEPPETFYATLISQPPPPLPISSSASLDLANAPGDLRPEASDMQGVDESESGPRFTQDLERAEGQALVDARRVIVAEVEALRQRLIDGEHELDRLRREGPG